MKNALFGILALSLLMTTPASAVSKQAIDEFNEKNARAFLASLPPESRNPILEMIYKIEHSKKNVIKINDSNSGNPGKETIYLIVHGLEFNDYAFFEPFHLILQKKKTAYQYTFSKKDSLKENVIKLEAALRELRAKNPDNRIVIFGYCTGGMLSTVVFAQNKDNGLTNNMFLHTVASPLNGYGAPGIARIAIPFFGKLAIETGMGLQRDMIGNAKLDNCYHWLTINEELDIHARRNNAGYPQFYVPEMPCGPENMTLFNDKTHTTIFNTVVERVFDSEK